MNQRIIGTVEHGDQRGRTLGTPTINLSLPDGIQDGVYASVVTLSGLQHEAVTFVGAAHTFDLSERKCETYIFDFDEDVYGKEATVELIQKIRDMRKFDGEEQLKAAIASDIDKARKIHTL